MGSLVSSLAPAAINMIGKRLSGSGTPVTNQSATAAAPTTGTSSPATAPATETGSSDTSPAANPALASTNPSMMELFKNR